ncbi:uncharacterized protein LOC136088678 [Hydra vulgaris]|uniref:Uncharacterized protein LOC136088678 n=1 Tax=Hydra vulgaris TaxID=6087 RepID=A0ABM4D493_HYDVU
MHRQSTSGAYVNKRKYMGKKKMPVKPRFKSNQSSSSNSVSSNCSCCLNDSFSSPNISNDDLNSSILSSNEGSPDQSNQISFNDLEPNFSGNVDNDSLFLKQQPIWTSSPINLEKSNDFSFTTIYNETSSTNTSFEDLYENAMVSTISLKNQISTLATKHQLSSAAVGDIFKLISNILPIPNKCPSYYQYNKDFSDILIDSHDVDGGIIYVLPYQEQISNLLKNNPNSQTLVKCIHQDSLFCDISDGTQFPIIQPNILYFLLNTDGLTPILSRKTSVWPLLLSFLNISPSKRRKLHNIVLVGLYIGHFSKPNWSQFLPILTNCISKGVYIDPFHLRCKIVALVADLPAKSSICNIQNFNAKNNATDADHCIHATEENPVFGVKRKTALTDLISLPICAPLDIIIALKQ